MSPEPVPDASCLGQDQLRLSPSPLWPQTNKLEGNRRPVLDFLSAVWSALEEKNPVNVLPWTDPKEMAKTLSQTHFSVCERQAEAQEWLQVPKAPWHGMQLKDTGHALGLYEGP